MSAVRHMDMGFHNDDSAVCNKTWVTVAMMVISGRNAWVTVALCVSNKAIATAWFT